MSKMMMQDNPGWELFLKLCTTATKKGNLEQLLIFLLTDEEVAQLEKRVLLVQALLAETASQREIAKDLQVSISKITRGSNSLKHIDADLKKFLCVQLNK
jgi:TrpR family transcriptional regulator, trp operon repressor